MRGELAPTGAAVRARLRTRAGRAVLAAGLALALAVTGLGSSSPAFADPSPTVTASIEHLDASRANYENARTAYLARRQPSLTDYRAVSALYSVASVDLTQAKKTIRNQFRIDVAAANKSYAAAVRGTKLPAVKAAALDTKNLALAQAAINRDTALNLLGGIPNLPPRPSK